MKCFWSARLTVQSKESIVANPENTGRRDTNEGTPAAPSKMVLPSPHSLGLARNREITFLKPHHLLFYLAASSC